MSAKGKAWPGIGAPASMVHGPGCTRTRDGRTTCECGANASCPNCHYGKAQYPCACRPITTTLQTYFGAT